MKMKTSLCLLGAVCLLSVGNAAQADEQRFEVMSVEVTCTDTSPTHVHNAFLCFAEELIMSGTAELDPWKLQVTADGSLQVPVTIKLDPNKRELNSPTQPTAKKVLFSYTVSDRTVREDGRLVVDSDTQALYIHLYNMIMGRENRFELALPPEEILVPEHDNYGNVKYYRMTIRLPYCNVGHSRKDNVIYLRVYSEHNGLLFPNSGETYSGDRVTGTATYRIMKDNAGIWKQQPYDLFKQQPIAGGEWNECDDQTAIEQLAQGLGINGKGR